MGGVLMNPWLCNLLFNNSGGSSLPITGQTFYAPLKTSLVPEVGTGGPTWSRATKAWGFNERGYLEELASGCAFFGGARLVRNACPSSEDFSIAAWTKNNLTVTGTNIVVSSAATILQRLYTSSSMTMTAGQRQVVHARLEYINHPFVQIHLNTTLSTEYVNFDLVNGTFQVSGGTASAAMTLVSPGVYDCYAYITCASSATTSSPLILFTTSLASAQNAVFAGDGIKSFKLLRVMSCDVTNYDASYVPEYVSVGVEASPYFGAGIDGAKYFETDWQGAPIPAANLLRFRRESSAINNLLHCRDLSNAAWSTKTNITAAKTATGIDGIANTATTLTAAAEDAIILQPTSGIASAARCASAYVKRVTGTGTISFTQDGGSTWTDITSQINAAAYIRVQITSTLANPSTGFKISTSTDVINVDVGMNEAGAVATSPIVTTTATVTRNAESLTYQTAGNWSDTAGTVYVQTTPVVYSGGAVGSATNGLLLSTSNSGATAYDGTNSANGPTGAPGTTEKLAVAWGSSAMSVASSGAVGTAGTYDGAMGLSSIGIGVGAVGYFGDVAIYNYKMTDAELQAITT
ncbi:MAG: hypothetical protein IPH82_21105 [Chloroflexi bacterium]|nr:hypothetical protein [Chloroflexota bacterium]